MKLITGCLVAFYFIQIYLISSSFCYDYYCDDDHSSDEPAETVDDSSSLCLTGKCVMAAGSVLSAMDPTADPCHDFYQFACGGFELRNMIAAGESSLKQGNIVDNIIQKQLRALLEQPTNDLDLDQFSARQKARQYYRACMDVATIETTAVLRIQEMVDDLGGFFLKETEHVPVDWTLNKLLAKRNEFSLAGPFSTSVQPDDKDVLVNVIKLEQSGLGLGAGTRDYYLGQEVTANPVTVAYMDMLQEYASIVVGKENVERHLIADVVRFEQKLAAIHRTQAEQEKVADIYFKCNVRWLRKHADFIDWKAYFNDLFGVVHVTVNSSEPILLYNAPYFEDLSKLMKVYLETSSGRRTLHNYFVIRSMSSYASYLGGQFQKAKDAFLATFLGKKGSQDRSKTCIEDTDSNVGFGLGAMYIDLNFSPEDRRRIHDIIADIVDAFRQRIETSPWMDDVTRERALEKVDSLSYDVGYPEWLLNDTYLDKYYEDLMVTDDFAMNQFLSFAFASKLQLSTLRKDPDLLKWFMTPQTINAYYEVTQNKIVIPAGILNSPFFYAAEGVPAALNYGAIGCVAGHEVSHAFDNIGREYDNLGNLHNWWTNVTRQRFEKRAKCLIEKFDAYSINGLNLRGDLTLSENIADDGALKTSYQAYKLAMEEGRLGKATRLVGVNLTSDQLFFVGWAQVWCTIATPETVKYLVLQDEHALYPFRVSGPLSNSFDFAEAFSCPVGSKMNPAKKCSVW